MTQIIDRRLNSRNKNAVNRQRFMRRNKNQIRKAVSDAVNKRHITDIENGEKITIPAKDINEPLFHHGDGGKNETVHPGNIDFTRGDRIERPNPKSEGKGGQATNTGEGLDNFVFEITKEEFLEFFFEDLELPFLIKKHLHQTSTHKLIRAGYSTSGSPSNINIVRSFKNSFSRRLAVTSGYKKKLKEAEEKLKQLTNKHLESTSEPRNLLNKIEILKAKIRSVPYFETFDLRYNFRNKQPYPSTQAVMFCLMDVSGSMDETKKDIAKRFFILLYLFLSRNYQKIDIVFIRHHTTAKEVDEKEFFYSRETGGTVVSSALELMHKIMQERYSSNAWNIYGAQASDGDNWNADSPFCQELLTKHIMPNVQYFSYIEIKSRQHQSLWDAYQAIKSTYPHFAMKNIYEYGDIYPVFHELFKRQTS